MTVYKPSDEEKNEMANRALALPGNDSKRLNWCEKNPKELKILIQELTWGFITDLRQAIDGAMEGESIIVSDTKLKQATVERSHYYTANILIEAINELQKHYRFRQAIDRAMEEEK